MTNPHRGEASVMLGGERFVLRLTLQALAEIEAAFGASDLEALGRRFAEGRFRAADLAVLIGATARGGGASLSDAEIAGRMAASELPAAIAALAELFAASFGAVDGPA
jgi:hypothetical protein